MNSRLLHHKLPSIPSKNQQLLAAWTIHPLFIFIVVVIIIIIIIITIVIIIIIAEQRNNEHSDCTADLTRPAHGWNLRCMAAYTVDDGIEDCQYLGHCTTILFLFNHL